MGCRGIGIVLAGGVAVKEYPAKLYDPARDGVTASLLGTFLDCREKCRLHLQGWTARHGSMALTFGNITHYIIQHVMDDVRIGKLKELPSPKYMTTLSERVEKIWKLENPNPTDDTLSHFELTMLLVEALMPLYFKHWYGDDFRRIRWEALETEFKVPFVVRSRKGETFATFLRGKMDATFTDPGDSTPGSLRLFETKTKARIEEQNIADILPFERQVNLYMVAIRHKKRVPSGTLYNIIRRPALRQKKAETLEQFSARIIEDVRANLDWYFIRMQMDVDPQDLNRAEEELNDLVSDFVLWWAGETGHYKNTNHCENKYGRCQFLPVCAGRDYSQLFKREKPFSELEEM